MIATIYTWVSGGGGYDLMLHTGVLSMDPDVDTEIGLCTVWAGNRLSVGTWTYQDVKCSPKWSASAGGEPGMTIPTVPDCLW